MPIWRRKEDRERDGREGTEDRGRRDMFDDPFFEMRSDLFHDFDDQFRRMRSYMDAMMEKAASGELRSPGEGGPFVYGWSMRVGPDGVPHVQTFGNVRPPAMRGGRELTTGSEGAGRKAQGATAGERSSPGPQKTARGGLLGREDRSGGHLRQGGPEVLQGDDEGTEGSCERELMASPGVREPLTDICEGDREITVIAEMPGIEKDHIELETGDDFLVIKVEKGSRRYYKELPLNAKVAPNSARARYNNGVLEITVGKVPVEKKGTKVKVE